LIWGTDKAKGSSPVFLMEMSIELFMTDSSLEAKQMRRVLM